MAASDDLLVHNVFFRLHEQTPTAREALVAACRRYLPMHEGIVFFACGVLAESLNRDVNDRDWDVGLHIIFRNLAAHDAYQDSVPHHQFIEENRAGWHSVRVFDSLSGLSPTP